MTTNRPSFYAGLALIGLGFVFLFTYLVPGSWPVILVAIGLFFFVIAVLRREGWPVVTGLVNTTLGSILLYQTLTHEWTSWYYLWPLIFSAVGAGLLMTQALDRLPAHEGFGSALARAFSGFSLQDRYQRVCWGWLGLGIIATLVLWLLRGLIGWPVLIWGPGVLFLLEAVISGIGPFAIPGVILGGMGSILAVQNSTGAWDSWAYTWALIPGLVGLGLFLAFIRSRTMRVIGLSMLGWSLVMFVLFGTLFAGQGAFSYLWPIALITAGLAVIAQNFLVRRSREQGRHH